MNEETNKEMQGNFMLGDSKFKDITDYLRTAVAMGGSDLHLVCGAPPVARIEGKLKALENEDLKAEDCRRMIRAVVTEAQRARLERDWELDFAFDVEGCGRFRGNAHYVKGEQQAAFRYIPANPPDLDTLGHFPIVGDLCKLHQGLILVTGYTGSGKSTSMAAMLKRIAASRSGVIVSIEDPVEFIFSHDYCLIKQREIGADTKSFATALRQCLRQDPDVIVVSELRDLETIRTAITAAETGHLVIGTLHTIDAPKSLDRLIDVFPSEQQAQIITQLGNVLQAIISQKLLIGVDDKRVLASEVMIMNHAIRAVLRERKNQQIIGLMQIGAKEGMHTIDESLAQLVKNKRISMDTALEHCRDKEFVRKYAKN